MIAIQLSSPAGSFATPTGPAQAGLWRIFANRLNDLFRGTDKLEFDADVGFSETLPAICWAETGAHAAPIDGVHRAS